MIARRTYHKDFDDAENVGARVKHIENGTEASNVQSLVDDVAVKQNLGQIEGFIVHLEFKGFLL
jgi:hypothetical protein